MISSSPSVPPTFAEGFVSQMRFLPEAEAAVSEWLKSGGADLLRHRTLLLAGIGASYAVLGTPVYELRSGGVSAVRTDCSDMPENTPSLADAYIVVSQSGRSRETSQLVLDNPAAHTLAITNAVDSPLRAVARDALSVGGFPDSRVSTIGFSATLVALGMLAEELGGVVAETSWASLPSMIEGVLDGAENALVDFAGAVAAAAEIDVVATASQITSAEQGALLFREGPLVPSTAMGTRAYLHGPMDCAGRSTSHLLFGGAREGLLAEQLAQQKAPILLVTDTDVTAPASIIRMPRGLTSSQRSLLEVILAQRLVTLVGEISGVSVDSTVFTRLDTKVDSAAEVRVSRV